MKQYQIRSMLIGCMLLCLTGCTANSEKKRDVLRVGVVLYTQDDPFINALTDCLKEDLAGYESDSLKVIMTVRDGKNDQKIQNEVVKEMLDAGCEILVVDLVDRTEPSNIIKMAKKENVPVIFFNREPVREDLMQWDKLYYVGGDARQSGMMQGEIAADMIRDNDKVDRNQDGKIQYVLLEGETGHQDAIIRTDSVVKTIKEQGIIMEDWLKNYYEQTDPLKRQQMLLENKNETMSEDDKLRMKLWEARYGKGKPRKDMFVGYLMNLKYIVESGSIDLGGRKKKLAIEAILGLNLHEFESKPQTQKEIIFLELKNTCRKYIEISTGGRGFTSVIFGMGQLSDESIAGKIAEQMSKIVFDAPHSLRMEKEFEPLQRAALEVFREMYPNREHFLKKR